MTQGTMKAVVYSQYGSPDVLQLQDVAKPIPQDGEILVKIIATAVNSGDARLRRADPFAVRFFLGLTRPKINILGSVLSGVVEQVGKSVTLFKVGDEVFGATDMRFGAYAGYKCMPEKGALALKPKNASHQESAVIPFGGTTALFFLKKAGIKSGQKVLVNGASGAVGSAAIQLAKYYGAHVTAVCSADNGALVKSLGADKVIDYKKEDFTQSGQQYDVIFDTVDTLPMQACLRSLRKNGLLILSAANMATTMKGMLVSMVGTQKVLTGWISQNAADIVFLKGLVEQGKLKPVIDKVYPLSQISAAHTYLELGHKKGNLAVDVQAN